MVSPDELRTVKEALDRDPNNLGVGVIHEPTGEIHLRPFDSVPGGHAELAGDVNYPLVEARGFVIVKRSDGYQVVNASHLNNQAGQGAPGNMQMPADLFAKICQELAQAGL